MQHQKRTNHRALGVDAGVSLSPLRKWLRSTMDQGKKMTRPIQVASSAIVAALAVAATPAMAADLTEAASHDHAVAPISMDSFGNLMFAGASSDDLLASSYGLMPGKVGMTGYDVNVGKCTVTNNCACGKEKTTE